MLDESLSPDLDASIGSMVVGRDVLVDSPVVIGGLVTPYTYSDMTGHALPLVVPG